MAEIKAFRGMRYNTERAGRLDELCCPPYDIISEKERKSYLAQNKYNVIRLELPKEGDNVYTTAGEVLDRWREKGILIHEDKPAIYIYEEEFNAYNTRRSIKGIIARVKVEEFSKGVILPHEFTLSKAKADRFNLMKATNCNFSQIYALYMDEEHTTLSTIDELSKRKPNAKFTPTRRLSRSCAPISPTESSISPTVTTATRPRSTTATTAARTVSRRKATLRTTR